MIAGLPMDSNQKINEIKKEMQDAARGELAGLKSAGALKDPGAPPPPDSAEIIRALHENEIGDSRLFVRLFANKLAYDHNTDTWYEYDTHCWQEDLIDNVISQVQQVTALYAGEIHAQTSARIEAERSNNKDAAKTAEKNTGDLLKRIRHLQTLARTNKIIILARSGAGSLGIAGDEWDRNPWLLACINAVVDLRTGQAAGGLPSDFIKSVSPTPWEDIEAPAPLWEKFLHSTFDGNIELVSYVQRLLGYALSGQVTEHILPILHGQGRNGKDTLLETISYVLGPLASPVESELLLEQGRSRSAGAPAPEIVELRGKKIVWASETGEGRWLNSTRVKWLTGGNTLKGRALFGRQSVKFKPSHTLFLVTNFQPHVSAGDYAFWQRVHMVPFEISFVSEPAAPNERPADKELQAKLREEAPGILAWLVRGCLEWQQRGLDPPAAVKAATAEYHNDEDVIGQFLEECTEPGSGIRAGELYESYKAWCDQSGHRTINQTRFGKEIKKRYDWEKSRATYYIGLTLSERFI